MTKLESLHREIKYEIFDKKISNEQMAKSLGIAVGTAVNLRYRINQEILLSGRTYNQLCKMLWKD